ncbi:two-component system response regulator [Massilia sp. Root418]|jgi:two-component system catabolic regulation response regulator CreB|uniref:two-component system response regulator CreB n=1 Tax=Massilia sp. Root418 TaxID=1736532 RepID=UPI0006F436A6|nr:two-component system response regulator CreB [Massilia sp. Root418]KQW88040.1 two-component system response regulator [Massilia sp. Root418]
MARSILIVEDEQAIADGIAYALRTDGFAPLHVTLGELALAAMRGDGGHPVPELVVLDIGLPDMSGLEVCRRLRQFSDAPVIFLTARSDEIDRVVGLEIGADDYVTKPFSPRELVARIRVILRRMAPPAPRAPDHTAPQPGAAPDGPGALTAQSAPATRQVSGLELRALEARILYCGQALDLTRYEYLLLKTLIEHPGHVLSRAQLMDRVWTGASDTLDRTVDAHVKSLRAKLRAVAPDADPIQTHRGLGYSLASA